ncbi:hypothetical protein GGTG_09103 [Gaeumannomyces tritici R3-111a-1]|uniref:AB hydrolase-1 domain-containing protein n=1 Tax=Gaeumannomyces tritici (strain R3-111a-1) TaxID=644352 RepID=J3P6G3_GAET3|nr:hypothetical protein GGTG_09103 [Gaeumannomyces tritici R3-111a-1]EJT72237.1 hypothetical protein GGTG_09103 [Gaeumannomyces tritici R3-111a-1]
MAFQNVTQAASIAADGVDVFFRTAGDPQNPAMVLLHGFPTSSHMFRNLIPLLALNFYVVAPDLPAFGFTKIPAGRNYAFTFDALANTFAAFLDAMQISRYAVYVFDYGAPVAMRVAAARPDSVAAIITQNGNAYEEGLDDAGWAGFRAYWASNSTADRDALRPLLTLESTQMQYSAGFPFPEAVQREAAILDQALLDAGDKEVQLDLFFDYRKNVELYPSFQQYFRDSGVPILAAWGNKDPFFTVPGAQAYGRDARVFQLELLDAGHFALETNEVRVAELINGFVTSNNVFGNAAGAAAGANTPAAVPAAPGTIAPGTVIPGVGTVQEITRIVIGA